MTRQTPPYPGDLGVEVPEGLRPILGWDFLPWDLVRRRHGDDPAPFLALLSAWRWVAGRLDLAALAGRSLDTGSGDCLRCGTCCAHKRPAPVSAATFRRWKARGTPVGRFFRAVPGSRPRVYDCWFFGDVRLRVCPLLLVNRNDGRPFCAIHHLGPGARPPRCRSFRPHPPSCQTGQEGLVV